MGMHIDIIIPSEAITGELVWSGTCIMGIGIIDCICIISPDCTRDMYMFILFSGIAFGKTMLGSIFVTLSVGCPQ